MIFMLKRKTSKNGRPSPNTFQPAQRQILQAVSQQNRLKSQTPGSGIQQAA
jgi:hypothetical protein